MESFEVSRVVDARSANWVVADFLRRLSMWGRRT